MPITPFTAFPTRASPTTFDTDAETFFGELPTFVSEANALEANVNAKEASAQIAATTATAQAGTATTQAGLAAQHKAAAEAAAVSAINAPGTSATSTTSLTVGLGAQVLTIQPGKAFSVGQFVVCATSAPGNYMIGQVTAYDSVTGVFGFTASIANGDGTHADWTISLTAVAKSAVWLPKTAAYTAVDGDHILADVSAGGWELGLTATQGTRIRLRLWTGGSANGLAINPGVEPIDGEAGVQTIYTDGISVELFYDATKGWVSVCL